LTVVSLQLLVKEEVRTKRACDRRSEPNSLKRRG
jgi:hypothetical protein